MQTSRFGSLYAFIYLFILDKPTPFAFTWFSLTKESRETLVSNSTYNLDLYKPLPPNSPPIYITGTIVFLR